MFHADFPRRNCKGRHRWPKWMAHEVRQLVMVARRNASERTPGATRLTFNSRTSIAARYTKSPNHPPTPSCRWKRRELCQSPLSEKDASNNGVRDFRFMRRLRDTVIDRKEQTSSAILGHSGSHPSATDPTYAADTKAITTSAG